MPYNPPIPVDNTNQPLPVVATTGGQAPQPITFGTSQFWIGWDLIANVARAYKSVDGGVNWMQKDAANVPTSTGQILGSWDLDETGTKLRVAWVDVTLQQLVLQDFDLTSETWQPSFATAGFLVASVCLCMVNPVGDTVVILNEPDISPTQTPFKVLIYSAGSFGSPFELATNSPYFNAAGQDSPFGVGYMDSASVLHVVYAVLDPLGTNDYVNVYQQVNTLTSTLGTFTVFPVQNQAVTLSYNAGQPSVIGTNLVIPYFATTGPIRAGVYVGNAVAGGPFVLSAAIDPGFTIAGGSPGACSTDATTGLIYLIYIAVGSADTRGLIRSLTSPDGVVWTGETAYDDGIPGDLYQWPTVGFDSFGDPLLVLQGALSGTSQAFAFGAFVNPPAPSVSLVTLDATQAFAITLPNPAIIC